MRNLSATQETSYDEGDAFPAEANEQALDRLTMLQQQADGVLSRALRAPKSDGDVDELPNAVSRASKYLGFDANGDPIASTSLPDSTDITNLILGSRYATLAAAVTAAGTTPSTILLDSALPIGGDVTIPATLCLESLHFGGSVSGTGTLSGSRWKLAAGPWQVFGSSITVTGTPAVDRYFSEWFGAVRDGATDDSAAFAALAAHLKQRDADYWGGVVQLLPGTYRLEEGVTFDDQVQLIGAGMDVTRFSCTDSAETDPFLLFRRVAAPGNVNGGGIRDLSIVANDVHASSIALEIKNCFKFFCHRVKITGSAPEIWGTGIKLTGYSFEADVQSCRIDDVSSRLIDFAADGGVYPNSTVVQNCDFSPLNGATAIYNPGANNLKVLANHIEFAATLGGTAIDLSAVKGAMIANNLIGANYSTQITIAFTSGGTYAVQVGDVVDGNGSLGTATVTAVNVTSGSWAGGDAAGTLVATVATGAVGELAPTTGAAETLNVGANLDVCTVSSVTYTNYQIRIRGGAKSTQILGNKISLTGGTGVEISGSGSNYVEIIGNGFEIDYGRSAIREDGRSNLAVVGNSFRLIDSAGAEGLSRAVVDILNSATQVRISDNLLAGEGSGDVPGAGILLTNGCTLWSIAGNKVVNFQTGIMCLSNASAIRGPITGNVFTGNGTAMVLANLADVHLRDNVGYVDHASGTGAVPSGATISAAISHGLSFTPTAQMISVTPTNSPSNDPGAFWISDVGATSFKINTRADPGASTATFVWKVTKD
jgi:hypothetical protein